MNMRDLIPWGRERSPASRGGEIMDPFLALHRAMNRLFDDFSRDFDHRLPLLGFGGGLDWPHADLVETDREYRVTAELPGLEEKDVELTFQDGVLILKGEKKVEHNGDNPLRSERYYGRFQRALAVGSDVDEDKVEAIFKNGLLTVVLPKSPDADGKVKRIPVNAR